LITKLEIVKLHHVAIICSNYQKSKQFYTEVLGFEIAQEIYREDRKSYKLDLSLNGQYLIELFSFPEPPQRITRPEATGLRHISFAVKNIENAVEYFNSININTEQIRIDEHTNRKFTFLKDPDNLPIEIYEL
jgi:glyoxylase I family protein